MIRHVELEQRLPVDPCFVCLHVSIYPIGTSESKSGSPDQSLLHLPRSTSTLPHPPFLPSQSGHSSFSSFAVIRSLIHFL